MEGIEVTPEVYAGLMFIIGSKVANAMTNSVVGAKVAREAGYSTTAEWIEEHPLSYITGMMQTHFYYTTDRK